MEIVTFFGEQTVKHVHKVPKLQTLHLYILAENVSQFIDSKENSLNYKIRKMFKKSTL